MRLASTACVETGFLLSQHKSAPIVGPLFSRISRTYVVWMDIQHAVHTSILKVWIRLEAALAADVSKPITASKIDYLTSTLGIEMQNHCLPASRPDAPSRTGTFQNETENKQKPASREDSLFKVFCGFSFRNLYLLAKSLPFRVMCHVRGLAAERDSEGINKLI